MRSLHDNKLAVALFVLVILCAGVVLFRSPFNASNLDVIPDSVEYATVAIRLVTHGTYDITLNGASYPSVYEPWFSMLLLAPAYKLLGPEPGNGILPVFLFGVAGIGAAFLLGKRVSGYAGGWLAALFVLLLPYYRLCGKIVLTDVPATALVLILCLLFLELNARKSASPRGIAVSSALLLGLSAALRPATAACVVPFLLVAATLAGRRRILLAALFLIPLLAAALMEAAFNSCMFGDPFRNGRKFWCAVPWDYPRLTFALGYVRSNLRPLLESGVVYLLAVLGFLHLLVRRLRSGPDGPPPPAGDSARSLGLFAVLGLGPLVLFHMIYFYPSQRFFLPVAALLAVMAGAWGGWALDRLPLRTIVFIQAGLLVLVIGFRLVQAPEVPKRVLAAEAIRDLTPTNAIIITGIDAAYLGTMLGEQSRRFVVPISRNVEYASKLVCYRRIDHPEPAPVGWLDHRCPGLERGGAVDVIRVTATENLDWIMHAMRNGRPVFLNAMVLPEDVDVVNILAARFVATPAGPWLYRLTLPPAKPHRER